MKIAQQLIAGNQVRLNPKVPSARLKFKHSLAAQIFQPSLRDSRSSLAAIPSDQSLGYFQASLRDGDNRFAWSRE